MSQFGRLLRIDLTRRTSHVEEIPSAIQRTFLGGKGLGTAYLAAEVGPSVDPLSPENRLYFCPGALTGTLAPAACRYELVTLSPLTGLYLDNSSGGHWATAAHATGHDVIAIEGAAERPTALWIEDDQVTFLDAAEWWGLPVYETEAGVRARIGDPRARVACIGPAGENLVRLACVANDFSRQAARGGPGAVMGSKKCKAIAVSGTRSPPIARPDAFLEAVTQARQTIRRNGWVAGKRDHGTAGSYDPMYAVGAAPVNNFDASTDPRIGQLAMERWVERTALRLACSACPVSCSKGTRHGASGVEGPEYETISMLGPNCGLYDPEEVVAANYLCNQLGLDTISAGATLGLVLHALGQGQLSPGQLDLEGAPPTRGAQVRALLEAVASRRGIGDLLADGALRAGQALGLERDVPHVKAMEFPAYDPRVSEGMALAYMTSDRGACHLRTWPLGRELSGELPRAGTDGKVEFVVRQQNEKAAQECLGVCQFPYGIGLLGDDLARLWSAASGEEWDVPALRTVGERIWNLSRSINQRRGLTRDSDYLPERFSEPLPNGPIAGWVMSRQLQDRMLNRYYMLRGWSKEGFPRPGTIGRLGLKGLTAAAPRLTIEPAEGKR